MKAKNQRTSTTYCIAVNNNKKNNRNSSYCTFSIESSEFRINETIEELFFSIINFSCVAECFEKKTAETATTKNNLQHV